MSARSPLGLVAALLLAMPLAAVSPACGEQTAGGATKKAEAKPADPNAPGDPNASAKPAAATAPRIFTNRDLSKYHSSASAPRTVYVDMTPPAVAAADGASTPEESIPQDEKARRLAGIQNGIKEGEARLADLDKRLAFMANPYLPPPQLTPDEIAAQKGMSQKDAYRALEAEKAALVEKLSGLRADLEKVAALPTRPRGGAAAPGPDSATNPQP